MLDDQRVAAELGVGHFRHIQVFDLLAQRLVRGKIVHVRKEREEPPAVLEHLQLFLGFAGRGLQHEQHHAEVVLNVLPREGVAPLQQFDAPAGGPFQHLAIPVLAVGEGPPGLRVDRFGGHDPQHEPRLRMEILGVDPLDCGQPSRVFPPPVGSFKQIFGTGRPRPSFRGT